MGCFTEFEPPEEGAFYCMGADVAEGGPDGNFSAAHVFKRPSQSSGRLEQVAEYRDRIDPDLYAMDLDAIGRYYNFAWLAVENNSVGVAVTLRLFRDLKYPRLYWEERPGHEKNTITDRIGWRTTGASKPILVSDAQQFVREDLILLRSRILVDEMYNFREHREGETVKVHAMEGHKDDLVMAFGIAIQVHKRTPLLTGDPYTAEEEEEREVWTSSQLTDREFVERFFKRTAMEMVEDEPLAWFEEN